MKLHQLTIKALLLVGVLAIGACNYNRPPAPELEGSVSATETATHTIAQLKALYGGKATEIKDNVVVEAVVASDDSEGNLYKTCYIQDATGGIELRFAMGNMSTLYPQGAKVYLHAKGLTLGKYAEQINLGYRSIEPKYETAFLPEKLVPSALHFASRGIIDPKVLSIASVSKEYAGMLVRLDEVQFIESELTQTYADPEHKNMVRNVNRTLTDKSGKTIVVRTSSYARFAGKQLPQGSGSFVAVLNYFRDTPQLLLLRESDAKLSQPRF